MGAAEIQPIAVDKVEFETTVEVLERIASGIPSIPNLDLEQHPFLIQIIDAERRFSKQHALIAERYLTKLEHVRDGGELMQMSPTTYDIYREAAALADRRLAGNISNRLLATEEHPGLYAL